jgi:hypothetical protein
VIDGKGGQGQPLDGLDDEVNQIILGDPVAQVRGQQQRGVAVGVLEAVCQDAKSTAPTTPVFNSSQIFLAKSPTDS